ncbi:MAG TPA: tetratricopeptide repeat protein [Drouetiella sp.]
MTQIKTSNTSLRDRSEMSDRLALSGTAAQQEAATVQQWMRDKHICEDSNSTSWKLYLIGALSLALAIVTAFGAKSAVVRYLLNTPDSIPAHMHRGLTATASSTHAQARKTALAGDLDRAVNMYKKAEQECDPKNPARAELLNDLGVALTAAGKNDEASRYLKEAIQLNPSLIAAYNNLAISQMLSGDKASALMTLDDAVKAQPQNEYAALKLKRMWANSDLTR